MTQQHKVLAYILNTENHYTQTKIASLMQVSQSTVANMLKDIKYQIAIDDLEDDLQRARDIIEENGLKAKKPEYFFTNNRVM